MSPLFHVMSLFCFRPNNVSLVLSNVSLVLNNVSLVSRNVSFSLLFQTATTPSRSRCAMCRCGPTAWSACLSSVWTWRRPWCPLPPSWTPLPVWPPSQRVQVSWRAVQAATSYPYFLHYSMCPQYSLLCTCYVKIFEHTYTYVQYIQFSERILNIDVF